LNYAQDRGLVKRAAAMGTYLFKKLSSLTDLPMVGDIRGKGLLMGIELVKDKEKKIPFERQLKISETIAGRAFEKGLIIYPGSGTADGVVGDHIIISPPFIISETEIDTIFDLLQESILEIQKSIM